MKFSFNQRTVQRTRRVLRGGPERLEKRLLLAAELVPGPVAGVPYADVSAEVSKVGSPFTTNGSDDEVRIPDFIEVPGGSSGIENLQNSAIRIALDQFRADPRFSEINGTGFASVVIDSGIDLDHPHFGPDLDSDGIADRIVHQQSFTGTATADDDNGHGTHVQATVASSDPVHTGIAPGADLIALKTQGADGSGNFFAVEQALQWVVANAAAFNIASVNMSIGDGGFDTEAISRYGVGDELAALAALDVIVVSSSGNSFSSSSGTGVGYPSSDPNSLSIGSERVSGGLSGFSQRHPELTTVFAPGQTITAAWPGGGVRSLQGTSMASPHVAGVAILAQELAIETLGRRLTMAEFETLLRQTGPAAGGIPQTGADYIGVNMLELAEAILAMDVSQSDIQLTSFDAPDQWIRGETADVSLTVENTGSAAAPAFDVQVFASTNSTISFTGDILLGVVPVGGLAAGATFTTTLSVTLPDANAGFWTSSETYTIGALADADFVIAEFDETNNANRGQGLDLETVTVTNLPRDLRGQSIAVASSDGLWGGQVDVDFAIENIGSGPSEPTAVDFYLSKDATIDPATDRRLSSFDLGRVLAGGSLGGSITLDLPAPGDSFWEVGLTSYHIGMVSDALDSETELDETNNLNVGAGIDRIETTIEAPDSILGGTVYDDADGDAVIRRRFDGPVEVTHYISGHINPFSRESFRFENLPTFAQNARIVVRSSYDLSPATHTLNVFADGSLLGTMFQQFEVDGGIGGLVDTLELDSQAWTDAIADGVLDMQVDVNFNGSFSTSSGSYFHITLQYDAIDPDSALVTATDFSSVFRNTTSTVSLQTPNPAIGDGQLEMIGLGFLESATAFATVDVDGLLSLQMLDNGETIYGGLLSVVRESATIPMATLNQMMADGTISIDSTFSSGVALANAASSYQFRLSYPIASDDGVGGQTITLDLNNDGTIDATTVTRDDDPQTPVDESGQFEFLDVPAGNHQVNFVGNNFAATFPTGGTQAVTVASGLSQKGVDFGAEAIPDSVAPRVTGVWARSSQWSAEFMEALDSPFGFPMTGPGQLRSLPWASGIDELVVQFNEDVSESISPERVVVRGSDEADLVHASSLSYDQESEAMTISLLTAIDSDRVILAIFDSVTDVAGNPLDGEWVDDVSAESGDGSAGGQFNFRFNVLAGDVDGSGSVNVTGDVLGVFANVGILPSTPAEFLFDVNTSGDVNVTGDLLATFALNGNSLPTDAPSIPSPNTGNSGDGNSGDGNSGGEFWRWEFFLVLRTGLGLLAR